MPVDWEERAARATTRYEDGVARIPDEPDERQRQLTRTGNAAWAAGLCHLMARRFAEAVECERRAVQLRPHFGTAWRTLTASAGLAGDLETARWALGEAKRHHPSLSVEWVEKYHAIVKAEDRALYISGLRAAGLE
jgi:hypothetical protein